MITKTCLCVEKSATNMYLPFAVCKEGI